MTKHQQMRASELAHYEYVSSRADFEAGYEAAVKDAEVLVRALKFYTDTNSWAYTTYDNFHTMHDDARTVKLPGGLVDMSGEHACEALREYLGEE